MALSPKTRAVAHGRPRIPSKQDLMDFAFAVPDSPPIPAGRKTLQRRLSRLLTDDGEDDRSSVSSRHGRKEAVPFEGAMEGDARHEVCLDSLQPWTYLLTIPGKNVRDMLLGAFNQWIGCDQDQLVTIKQVVAYLHSASLIVDDIEDESVTRRGCQAAHIKYGIAPALNSANYVYFLALEKLLVLQNTETVFIFTNEMCNLHRGQGRDIFWRVNSEIVSEEKYLHMVQDKTGGLFRLAIRIMFAAASQARPGSNMVEVKEGSGLPRSARSLDKMVAMCNDLASYFQIRDDLINLASPAFHKKKGFCEDITEGKLSFIALHSLRALKGSSRQAKLLEILQLKTMDVDMIKNALVLMEETQSFDYTLNFLDQLKKRIDGAIQDLGGNKALSTVINTLAADLEDCNIQAVINSKN